MARVYLTDKGSEACIGEASQEVQNIKQWKALAQEILFRAKNCEKWPWLCEKCIKHKGILHVGLCSSSKMPRDIYADMHKSENLKSEALSASAVSLKV